MKGNRRLSDGTRVNITKTISRHEQRVLLTRGTRGLHIYACDEELRKVLKKRYGGFGWLLVRFLFPHNLPEKFYLW